MTAYWQSTPAQEQANRLLTKYTPDGALKAAEKLAKRAVSAEQEEFWEAVAEAIEERQNLPPQPTVTPPE